MNQPPEIGNALLYLNALAQADERARLERRVAEIDEQQGRIHRRRKRTRVKAARKHNRAPKKRRR